MSLEWNKIENNNFSLYCVRTQTSCIQFLYVTCRTNQAVSNICQIIFFSSVNVMVHSLKRIRRDKNISYNELTNASLQEKKNNHNIFKALINIPK